jgi:RNA polymerase sigma-70 factor (ECF subfamily)
MEDLVRAAQRGDPEAMDALVRALMPYVGRVCGAIALDRGDDAVQETFIAVLKSLGALREPAALKGWVRRIAVRESIRVAGGRTVTMDPDTLPLPEVPPADIATSLDIRATLAALAPEQRAILVLRDVDGLSEAEVALAMRVPVGTVKSRAHRARAAFRGRWQP